MSKTKYFQLKKEKKYLMKNTILYLYWNIFNRHIVWKKYIVWQGPQSKMRLEHDVTLKDWRHYRVTYFNWFFFFEFWVYSNFRLNFTQLHWPGYDQRKLNCFKAQTSLVPRKSLQYILNCSSVQLLINLISKFKR